MPRLLVIVDGSAGAAMALDRAMDMAQAVDGELVLLAVQRMPSAWESKRRRSIGGGVRDIVHRARASADARGIRATVRIEQGDRADVITRIAGQERCDQIFVAEPPSTLTERALSALSAAFTGRVAQQVINDAGIPVTVIAPKPTR